MTAYDPQLWPYKPTTTRTASRLFVSNRASHSTPGHHGRGKRWGLAPAPDMPPNGDGWIEYFLPDSDAYQAARDGDADGFLERTAALVWERTREGELLRPGKLLALCGWQPVDGVELVGGDASHRVVRDGDTLCCVCSRQAASEGRCHRVVIAHALTAAGWEVVLDGVPIGEMAPRPELERQQAEAPAAPQPAKRPRRKAKRRAPPQKDPQLGLGWGR